MVVRPHKPSALTATPGLPPQAQVSITHEGSRVSARLPSGESVEVLLHGATVLSWKDARGDEQLWVSDAAALDGSAPVRGGIPLVFPVFGKAPTHAATCRLGQHGFARSHPWDFLGKSTSEGPLLPSSSSSSSVKLDFGLSSDSLDEETRQLWPHRFGLLYSVTLDAGSITTALVVTNEGDEPFECQVLLHTYFGIDDINAVKITGIEHSSYRDKVDGATVKLQSADPITFHGETDRVYMPDSEPGHPIVLADGRGPRFRIVRDKLDDVVVWNPWVDKAASTLDFMPKDGWRSMVCVEAGSVRGWQKLEKGDTFEGAQTIYLI